jgi:hypothetical protein
MIPRVVWMAVLLAGMASAQDTPPAPRRIHLILKDGSYQIVLSYQVAGAVVRFQSAERDGETEEIPLKLVDLDSTRQWEMRHTAGAERKGQAPALDPELLAEERDRASLTPEVAPDLHLPELESLLALDTWRGTPELVPLAQTNSDLNRKTGHNILKAVVNPRAASHQIVQLKGEKAQVQMHVAQPAIYIRVGDLDESAGGGTPFVVDTGGADNRSQPKRIVPPDNRYVIVRTDVRYDARIVMSFHTDRNGDWQKQEDVIETSVETLPGGHWLKVTPKQPLLMGEYALVEVISEKEINLSVWDFGVHPIEPENRDAIKPEPKRPFSLERRRREPSN